MTPEQKQRAEFAISNWNNGPKADKQTFGDRMAALLQELVDVDDKFKANVIAAINAAAHNARHCEVDGQPVFFSRSGDSIEDTHTLTPCQHCGGSGAAEDCAPEPAPVGYAIILPNRATRIWFGDRENGELWREREGVTQELTPLYAAPPTPSVPDVANTFKRRAEEIVAMAMNRDNYAETNRLSAALIIDIANAAEATTQAEAPADVVRDAARYRWLRESDWYVGPESFYCTEGGELEETQNENWSAENLDASVDSARGEKGGAK